jgi:hypothetical protein
MQLIFFIFSCTCHTTLFHLQRLPNAAVHAPVLACPPRLACNTLILLLQLASRVLADHAAVDRSGQGKYAVFTTDEAHRAGMSG